MCPDSITGPYAVQMGDTDGEEPGEKDQCHPSPCIRNWKTLGTAGCPASWSPCPLDRAIPISDGSTLKQPAEVTDFG